MIETTFYNDKGISIITCFGRLNEKEIKDAVQSFYKSPTKNLIWDLSEASVEDISPEYVGWIQSRVRRLGVSREGGKTAFVAPKDLEYGMARMFQILSDKEAFPFDVGVFRAHDEAGKWLREKDE
jgi:hypothetical protein